ncbi:MAG: hypothetical protein D6732_12650 [Methanobacteriota archaeon]|nr:MAG: hypothetical protein D6732_12650 [Euryarchaeota archaeon]
MRDIMIKQIIAYVIVIFGGPVLLGTLAWSIPGIVIAKMIGQTHRRLEESISAFAEGFIASIAGYFIFAWLGAGPLWVVPIFVVIIGITWNSARNEGYLNIPQSTGAILSFLAIFLYCNQ